MELNFFNNREYLIGIGKKKKFLDTSDITFFGALDGLYKKQYSLCSIYNLSFVHNNLDFMKETKAYKNHPLKNAKIYTKECFVYIPNKDFFMILKISPFLKLENAKKVTELHKKFEQYYLEDEDLEKYLNLSESEYSKDIIERKAMCFGLKNFKLDIHNETCIHLTKKENLSHFLFESETERQFGFLKRRNIDSIVFSILPPSFINLQKKPFVVQISENFDENHYFIQGKNLFSDRIRLFGTERNKTFS